MWRHFVLWQHLASMLYEYFEPDIWPDPQMTKRPLGAQIWYSSISPCLQLYINYFMPWFLNILLVSSDIVHASIRSARFRDLSPHPDVLELVFTFPSSWRRYGTLTIKTIYTPLTPFLLHTTIDCRILGIPSALPYISCRSVD